MRPLTLALILIALLVTAWASGRTEKASDQLTQTVEELVEEMNPIQKYTAKWSDADGIEHKVETEREKDSGGSWEPVAEWAARHKANVDALKALFPPASQ